jgi:ubiquinone/menaquinone biosynthesis C-methylase UbiE
MREAARMAVEGSMLGIDLSAVAIDRARELARAKGIRNVTFLRADAQAYPFSAIVLPDSSGGANSEGNA